MGIGAIFSKGMATGLPVIQHGSGVFLATRRLMCDAQLALDSVILGING